MTYDTAYLASDYLKYVKTVQVQVEHEPHALKLARLLEVRVKIGLQNRSNPESPNGPQVMVQPWWYGNSDVLRHELAHLMLWWSGLESEIVEEFGDDLGWRVVENLCNAAVAFLKMPQPLVDSAIKEHGLSAEAVRHLRRTTRATPRQALHRLVYDDPDSQRAGWLTSGAYIAETAQCNWRLPFGWADRVPEPALHFPPTARVSVALLTPAQAVGVCWG